ncbi:hypothetical protein ABEB36_011674 [Hypothenemus hampei]|uniref:Uncharacterized protein n=1 Tax=Hypothenemus hampei TaxID=57062 RepID=A0ABD1E8N4_HYPHA
MQSRCESRSTTKSKIAPRLDLSSCTHRVESSSLFFLSGGKTMDLDLAGATQLETISSSRPVNRTLDFLNLSDLAVLQIGAEDSEVTAQQTDPVYEQFLADVWVGIVLTLMVLSCICFMCSCLIYHKFQEWKHRVAEAQNQINLENGTLETELPSYTIASGLPTYEEALEQLKHVKNNVVKGSEKGQENGIVEHATETSSSHSLSVFNLFGIYNKGDGADSVSAHSKGRSA